MFIYRFEDFLKQKHSLSELKTYPQLLQRSDIIGYTIQTFFSGDIMLVISFRYANTVVIQRAV